jgi:molecular chaperone HscB
VNCPVCGAALETPLGCGACGALLEAPDASPFATLGLAPSFEIDAADLKRRLLRSSRIVHPDYFGSGSPELRSLAERNSAALNEAADTLRDPFARADWLVRSLGGPSEGERREMPKAFLLEVLEWNEALEAASEAPPGSPRRAAVGELDTTLRGQRETVLANLRALLAPLPEHGSPKLEQARAELNALRYLENMLRQIADLNVEQATSRRV